MIVDTGSLVDGDWNRLRELLGLLAQPPHSAYDDGSERQHGVYNNIVYQA